MKTTLAVLALACAAVLPACVSQTDLVTGQVSSVQSPTDSRRRAEAHTALASEYFQRGNFTIALSETRLALTDDPNYAPAHNLQGLVYMELRELAPARQAFDKALALDGGNPEILNNYGWFLCSQNDGVRGVEFMMRAASDQRYATPEKAYLSAGLCMRRMGRNAEAEEYLRRAVLIRPDLMSALLNLAAITFERGAVKDAENYIGRYNRIASPSLDSLALCVKIARASGDRAAEGSCLQQLRRLHPDAPQTRELIEGQR